MDITRKTNLCVALGFGLYTLTTFIFSKNVEDNGQVVREATIVADTNKDGVTSIDEWKAVYRELGYQYDELNPRKLSASQLRTYLDKHRK